MILTSNIVQIKRATLRIDIIHPLMSWAHHISKWAQKLIRVYVCFLAVSDTLNGVCIFRMNGQGVLGVVCTDSQGLCLAGEANFV